MSVDLLPEELGFRRPFNHEVTETLRISNPQSDPVAFKVKTTAPKQYCVRPNSGLIPGNSAVEVQVLLQSMKEDPPLDAKCRDKFLVQSVIAIGVDEPNNITAFWQGVERNAKASIEERKIRVHFLPASAATPNGVKTAHEDRPPAYSSPSPNFGSPAPAATTSDYKGEPSSVATPRSTATNTAEGSGLAGAAQAVVNAVPTSQADLQRQLEDAKSQISKLTNQLADPQLRQRKVQEASEKVQTVIQQTNEGGVPLQIVAALCLVSFLIAYLFF